MYFPTEHKERGHRRSSRRADVLSKERCLVLTIALLTVLAGLKLGGACPIKRRYTLLLIGALSDSHNIKELQKSLRNNHCLKELHCMSQYFKSYFCHVQNYLEIGRNFKIMVC